MNDLKGLHQWEPIGSDNYEVYYLWCKECGAVGSVPDQYCTLGGELRKPYRHKVTIIKRLP